MTEQLVTQPSILPAGYTAALEGAALYDEPAAGRIFMRGRDRTDLLHRLSTADLLRLRPGQGARTVLTTPIGRIIDLLTVHALEDALLLVGSPGQGPPVFAHLKKNIFFNDQVTLEPAGRSYGQLALFGPRAGALLAQISGASFDELPMHHTVPADLAGVSVLAARRAPLGGQGFTLYIPAEHVETVRAALLAGGAASLGTEAFEVLRIERGYGVFGRELSQEYIPLETGLLDAISFTKGCYVGQEIIARMESRGRMAKQLRGLKLRTKDEGRTMHDEEHSSFVLRLSSLILPMKLEVDGKDAGDLTSVAVSPRLGPVALAYVRSAHIEPGSIVGVAGTNITGEVVELPFAGI
ncbi:MAG: YgfZ/GcvT domain-containing protein [Roseiflexaceae bacterium]